MKGMTRNELTEALGQNQKNLSAALDLLNEQRKANTDLKSRVVHLEGLNDSMTWSVTNAWREAFMALVLKVEPASSRVGSGGVIR